MNLLSKLFGKSDNQDATVPATLGIGRENGTENSVSVLEDLFVDKTPPALSQDQQPKNSWSLSTYLEQDFARRGYDDGYTWHSAEILDNKVRNIKADFQYNLALKVDSARLELVKLDDLKADVEGLSERLVHQIDNKVTAIRSTIAELEGEMAMISINQGLVMVAVHQYRDGFLRGTVSYQEEKMIASSTGLFN